MKTFGQLLLTDIDGSLVNGRLYAFYEYVGRANIRLLIYFIPILASLFYLGAGHDDTWIMLFAGETLGKGSWFLNHNGVPQEISTSVLGAVLAGAASTVAPDGEAYAYSKIFAWLPAMLAGIGVFEILRKFCGQRPAAYWLVVLCCVPQWHYWAWGGVESGLFWLAVVLFAYSLAVFSAKPDWRSGLVLALVAALLPLVRADALWAPLLLLYFAVFARGAPLWLRWMPLILASALTAAFHLTRHAMTGAWLPNPAYAKAAFSLESVGYGIAYLTEFHTDSPLHIALAFSLPLSVFGVYRLLRSSAETGGLQSRLFEWSSVLVLTIDLTTIVVGGDWMTYHRFAVRSLPLKIIVMALWTHDSFRHGSLSSLEFHKRQLVAKIFLIIAVSGLTATGKVDQPHLRVRLIGLKPSSHFLPWKGLENFFVQRNGESLRDISAIRPWIEKDLPALVENARKEGHLPLKVASYQGGFFPREMRRHFTPQEVLFIDLGGLSDYRIGKLPGQRAAVGLIDGTYNWAQTFAYKQEALGQFLANCQPDLVYVISSSPHEIRLMDIAGYQLVYRGLFQYKEKKYNAASIFEWVQKGNTGVCAPLVQASTS